MPHNVKPWRFLAQVDIPELGVLAGDLVTHTAGRSVRVTRTLPVNSGLLLNLLLDDKLVELQGVIGADAGILDAMDRADATNEPSPSPDLRVVR
jgi:hypothetical protein